MIMLKALLAGFVDLDRDARISGLSLDSRSVAPGDLFIALDGANQHGLLHVQQAINNGAKAIIYETSVLAETLVGNISALPVIAIPELSSKLGAIATRFYGYPSERMAVIGITGTNGKTSCSQFLSQVLTNCGVIGTLGWGTWGHLRPTLNTTPDALAVQSMLAELGSSGSETVAMEVSSHGLDQGRVNGVRFKGAVFTNITRDHLDYHGNMDAYLQAKLKLLTMPGLEFAVVNLDDAYSKQVLAAIPAQVAIWCVSAKSHVGCCGELISVQHINHRADGLGFDVEWRGVTQNVKVPLYGDFNIDNVLSVLAVMLALGMTFSDATSKLTRLQPVAGRMERLGGDSDPLVFVDYAHTPDALEKVLSSVKQHCANKLWVVFGCGGNRDAGKRPQMGACAEQWADRIIVTDDNPRFEDPADIVNQIIAGCLGDKVEIVANRAQAIQQAIVQSQPGDCIVVAGKGHEQYQEINGVKLPFSDTACVQKALAMRGSKNAHAFA